MTPTPIRCVLFDLDGVVRHFDPAHVADVERRHGLTFGDPDILGLVAELRTEGFLAAILTNGTDTIAAEMTELDLDVTFDAIFNSAEIGVAKPDPKAFRHVCEALAVAPHEVFFTDDSPSKLVGAREVGMAAEHFTDVASLRAQLEKVRVTPQR